METLISNIFDDFDIDKSKSLEKPEIKLLLDVTCDKFNVERCQDWQVDYIISLLDIDRNGHIDKEELVYQYGIINREILKNKYLKKTNDKNKFNSGMYQIYGQNDN